jgi:hypothetical protein
MPQHPKTISIESTKGLNNVLTPERTASDYLKEAMNVDIDKSGGIKKRKGYTSVVSGNVTALWANGGDCIAVIDGDMVRVLSDYNTIGLVAGVGTGKFAFEKIGSVIYYVSDTSTGIIEQNTVRDFGINRINPRPLLSTGLGNLTAGLYQVALTYVASDGRESGAGVAQSIEINNNGAIVINNIIASIDTTVDTIRVYCSTPNGEVLYLVDEIVNGTTSHTIGDVYGATNPLQSFNIYPAPNGHIIRQAHGRLWIASNNLLWYSDPLSYEWFSLTSNYFDFEDRITAIMPTESGIWVAAEKLYYLSGKDPVSIKRMEREPVQVIEGTDVKIPGAYLFIENTPIGFKWLVTTTEGIYVCYDDGITLNLSSKNVSIPLANEGTGTFIQEDGINRYLSILQEKKDSDNTAVGDLVTSTVIRNGIVIASD